MKERKDRDDNAMHATRPAVEGNILPGRGVALPSVEADTRTRLPMTSPRFHSVVALTSLAVLIYPPTSAIAVL